MKKFISLILTICTFLTLISALSACDNKNVPKHIHKYESVWSSDPTYHWYACEDETCTSISQKSEHSFVNNICSICQYENEALDHLHTHSYKTEWSYNNVYHWHACEDETCTSTSQKGEHQLVNDKCSVCLYEDHIAPLPPANLASHEVTEEQFSAALSFGDEAIITIAYTYHYAETVGEAVLRINKNAIYFKTTDNISGTTETYYDIQEQNSYVYVYTDSDVSSEYSGWIRQTIDPNDEAHIAPHALERFESMFRVVDFSDCVYSDGYYTCMVEAMTWKFQFEDGVLVSFSNTYVDDAEEFSETYIFSDYSNTVVSLPTEYTDIDEVIPEDPNDWADYFDFESLENVTASSTYVYDYTKVGTMQQDQSSILKICGDKRLLTDMTSYWTDMDENGEWVCDSTISSTYYFDGETIYKDGTVYNDISIVTLGEFYGVKFFAAYESYFTKTSTTTYVADNIYTDYGIYANVKIIIENEKIQYVEYEFIYDGITSKSTLAFSDWETTTIN